MADEDVTYRTQTAKSVRGLEARTISQWEQRGWEFVSQTPGRVTTELRFRQPKKKTPWKWYAIGGGVIALLIVALIVNGTIRENADRQTAPVATETSQPTKSPSASRTATSTPSAVPSPAEDPANTVVTLENDPEFARVLTLTDYCSADIAAFAQTYAGRTVSFNAFVGALNNHGSAKTRYDILINAGDFDPDHSTGPMFQFRDVNLVGDLNYAGEVPDTLTAGQNLTVTAVVDQYEDSSCLLLLEPVETSFR